MNDGRGPPPNRAERPESAGDEIGGQAFLRRLIQHGLARIGAQQREDWHRVHQQVRGESSPPLAPGPAPPPQDDGVARGDRYLVVGAALALTVAALVVGLFVMGFLPDVTRSGVPGAPSVAPVASPAGGAPTPAATPPVEPRPTPAAPMSTPAEVWLRRLAEAEVGLRRGQMLVQIDYNNGSRAEEAVTFDLLQDRLHSTATYTGPDGSESRERITDGGESWERTTGDWVAARGRKASGAGFRPFSRPRPSRRIRRSSRPSRR
ncbi:MAG: hypothetical protein QJR03_08410 [Sphaerobacter sp.]|nr:hypothetical protein [Sphaerobacter sp.]